METKDNKKTISFVIDDLKYRVLSKEDKTVEVMTTNTRIRRLAKGNGDDKDLESIVIPSHIEYMGVNYTVIAVADHAFEDNAFIISTGDSLSQWRQILSGIHSVMLPPTVRKIGERAFYRCFALSSINIPASVEIIGNEAFKGCFCSYDPWWEPYKRFFSGLQHVIIEENCDDIEINGSIGENAFSDCQLLEEIVIPGRFKSIGSHAFEGCKGYRDSYYCDGETIYTYGLKKVLFHNGVKRIGAKVFEECDMLRSFNLPRTVEVIDSSLYKYCGERSIETCICKELWDMRGTLIIPWHIRKITDKENCFCYSDTVKSYIDSPNEIEIAKSLDFFGYLQKLILLPGCVEKYNASIFWGFNYFEELGPTERLSFAVDGLRYIVLSYSKKTVEVMSSYIPLERYGEKVDDIELPLEDVVILDEVYYEGIAYKVTKISTHGFVNHANLKSLSISSNVKSIGDYAFYQCNKLKSIVIPAGVTDIGEYAFAELSSASIQMEEKHADDDEYCAINSHAFENSGRGDLIIPRQVNIIYDYAFYNNHFNNIQINGDDVLIDDSAFSS